MEYRSGLERKIADFLSNRGVQYEYESTKVPYVLKCNYNPDFILPSGIMLEAKGHLSPDDRRKMLAVKKQNPELDIRFVFQAPNNKLKKGGRMTYADWSERYGFRWCKLSDGIPEEWLDNQYETD